VAPAIRHPLTTGPHDGLPALDEADGYIKNAIAQLLGHKSLLSSLIFDGFARRFVATVNNLGTDSAASQMWPVTRTEGRFAVDLDADKGTISAANAARYTPFVTLVDGVSTSGAVALYLRLYPLFQKAYEELGTQGHYFNDRVIEVIDNLLATPDVGGPIKVKLVQVDGAAPPPGGARLYVFDDPALESATAGQKILLRMGADNARKLKAKLADVRKRLVEAPR
jgi:hypothetical protein